MMPSTTTTSSLPVIEETEEWTHWEPEPVSQGQQWQSAWQPTWYGDMGWETYDDGLEGTVSDATGTGQGVISETTEEDALTAWRDNPLVYADYEELFEKETTTFEQAMPTTCGSTEGWIRRAGRWREGRDRWHNIDGSLRKPRRVSEEVQAPLAASALTDPLSGASLSSSLPSSSVAEPSPSGESSSSSSSAAASIRGRTISPSRQTY